MSGYSGLPTEYGTHNNLRMLQAQQPQIMDFIDADLTDPDRMSEIYLVMKLFFLEQR